MAPHPVGQELQKDGAVASPALFDGVFTCLINLQDIVSIYIMAFDAEWLRDFIDMIIGPAFPEGPMSSIIIVLSFQIRRYIRLVP